MASVAALGGCHHSSTDSSTSDAGRPSNDTYYMVGGTVSGLDSGESLVLLDNGGSPVTVSANGAFSFATGLTSGTDYAITVGTEPTGQACSVAGGTGTIASANAANAAVTCSDQAFSIGGSVQGLDASGLVLANGSSTYDVEAGAASFTMPGQVTYGGSYDVTVQASPPTLDCSVANGAGTVGNGDVTNISVSCTSRTETMLYSFEGASNGDGANPLYGSLVQTANGYFYGLTENGGAYGNGSLFQFDPSTGTETVLYSFGASANDGANPLGSLIQANDGNFYGLTDNGGTYDEGTLFEFEPSTGTETVLYSFGVSPSDGSNPFGSLIQASDGNFYGMTNHGGANSCGASCGTLFEYNTTTHSETVLHSFAGHADGSFPQGTSLIQATDGNLYGLTLEGGSADSGTIFEYNINTPSYSVLYSFAGGSSDGSVPNGSLIEVNGNFYGTTVYGGTNNNGTLFEYNPATGIETVLYSFGASGSLDGAIPEGNLIQSNDGDLYGTTSGGGTNGDGTLFEYNPTTGTETVLYSFAGAATDGASPYGSLIQAPNGVFYGMTEYGGAGNFGTIFDFN